MTIQLAAGVMADTGRIKGARSQAHVSGACRSRSFGRTPFEGSGLRGLSRRLVATVRLVGLRRCARQDQGPDDQAAPTAILSPTPAETLDMTTSGDSDWSAIELNG